MEPVFLRGRILPWLQTLRPDPTAVKAGEGSYPGEGERAIIGVHEDALVAQEAPVACHS